MALGEAEGILPIKTLHLYNANRSKVDNIHILTESDRLLMVKTKLVIIIERTNKVSEF